MTLRYKLHLVLLLGLIVNLPYSFGQKKKDNISGKNSFPESIECTVKPYYRHRTDGKPGREVMLHFAGKKFSGKGTIKLESGSITETIPLDVNVALDSLVVVLPEGIGVNSAAQVIITLANGEKQIVTNVTIPPKRQWTVYIYPHSHVDIGYTNTHENVELIHKRNLIYGIDLAKKTQDYPKDARYLWNPEVLWPVERYLRNATAGPVEIPTRPLIRNL